MDERIQHDDIEAFLEVRREQGRAMEPALIDSMAARIEETVRRRYEAEVQNRVRQNLVAQRGQGARLALAIVSIIMGIPLTAISASMLGITGLLIVWTGIVAVNIAMALRRPPTN